MSQVNVPTAQMEEILPAARLLSRATSPSPSDYERARTAFIQGVHEVRLQAQVLIATLLDRNPHPAGWDIYFLHDLAFHGGD